MDFQNDFFLFKSVQKVHRNYLTWKEWVHSCHSARFFVIKSRTNWGTIVSADYNNSADNLKSLNIHQLGYFIITSADILNCFIFFFGKTKYK